MKSNTIKCLLNESSDSITEGEENISERNVNLLGDTYEVKKEKIEYIMGSLTIPPSYNNYYKKTHDEQKLIMQNHIVKLIHHKKIIPIIAGDPEIYYELHKNCNIHSHVLFPIYEEYHGYEHWNTQLNKIWKYNIKGRKISGLFKHVFNYKGAKKYCTKASNI